MLTVLDFAQEDIQFNQRVSTRREKKGPCPGCGGNDRFSVKQDDRGRWVFMCRGCWDPQEVLTPETAKKIGRPNRAGQKRGWGDEIDFLRHFKGMNYQQARTFVGDPDQEQPEHVHVARATNWQEAIARSAKECECRLWSEDTTALDYVRGRGLEDGTIRGAHLGYSVKDGIPRLVIPSYNDSRYLAVYRRDLRADVGHSERWKDVAGSTKDELYLADCLQRRRPTVLVEAPLCALTIAQEVGNLVNAVATAGTDGARTPKTLTQLAVMPLVLVAFDADTSGDENADYWLQHLPNARRLRPLLKDINDMLTEGWDIRGWIEQALLDQDAPLLVASTEPTPDPAPLRVVTPDVVDGQAKVSKSKHEIDPNTPTSSSFETHEPYEDPLNFCTVCGAIVADILQDENEELIGYCTEHLPQVHRTFTPLDNAIVQAVQATFNATVVEVMPAGEWKQRKAELLQEARDQDRQQRASMVNPVIKRGKVWQKLIDHWIEYGEWSDYQRMRLEEAGYGKEFKASNVRIASRYWEKKEVAS